MNKENISIPPEIYAKLLENQQELTNYLKYIRQKPENPKITINVNFLKENPINPKEQGIKQKKNSNEVKVYTVLYLRIIKEISQMETYVAKKIMRKIVQYLEELPSMAFLVQKFNSFGKQKKKLCQNETMILRHAFDDMIPLFQKIIEKIQILKKQAESKKLMQLGHRIEHLQKLVWSGKHLVNSVDSDKIFKTFDSDRFQKYMVMEENINKAEKHYGKFSQNFVKNKQVFVNINKVYQQINQSTKNQ